MSWLRFAWRSPRLLLHVILGAMLTALLTRRDRATGRYRHNPYVVSWWHDRALRILHVEVDVTGARPQGPALLVANHISWLDIPVIGSLTHSCFLSKAEVRRWPLVGWLAAASGTLFMRRGGYETAAITATIKDQLAANGMLTLFPEGTTTDGSDVRPFFSRLFAAAIEAETPVIPVTLYYHLDGHRDPVAPYTGNQRLVDNLLNLLKRPATRVKVTFAEPLDMRGMTRKAAAERARAVIRRALGAFDHAAAGADSSAATEHLG
ncbi:MAG: lysophospholipid acyltransferase family protein [Gammaproteobacteria bacterium]